MPALAKTLLSKATAATRPASLRAFTTYSGGQAYEGQGGFYGSIKTRSEAAAKFHPGSRAEPQDVTQLAQLMQAWDVKKAALASQDDRQRAAQQLLAQDEAAAALLSRLVVRGAPAWGLSSAQRKFVAEFAGVAA